MGRTKNGALIIGDANHAIDKILQMLELCGLTYFSGHMNVGGPWHIYLLKLKKLFENRIATKVREA